MQSCWIRTEQQATSLAFLDVPTPTPGAGDVLVRVRAAGLNRGELIAGSVMHAGKPKLGGTEASGEVVALGAGVSGIEIGQRVMGRVLGYDRGAFAEYALMEASEAIALPARLTWEQAAAIPVAFMVAYDALFHYGRIRAGDWVLIAGVSSGTGVACLQAAKAVGARVIGTSGSADKLKRLEAAGLAAGIATRQADFAERVREITGGHGADIAVNCVGGSVFPACLAALAFSGRLATVGYVDGVYENRIDLKRLHADRLELYGVSNSRLDAAGRAASVAGFVRELLPAFADGRITPLIDRAFAFDELPQAKAYMESNAQAGKIVVRGV